MKNNLAIFVGSILLISSCTPYHRIAKAFASNKTSIEYIHEPGRTPAKKDIAVSISRPVITERFKSGYVQNVKTVVIPAIIYWGWNYQYECAIGRNQVKENINSFIQTSLVDEGNRKGIFSADTISNHPFSIEIEVDSIQSSALHKTDGFFLYFFFFAFRHSYVQALAQPTYCRFHFRLRKGDEILLDRFVSNTSSLDFLKPYPFNTQTLNVHLRAYLVESLGDAIKKNVEAVVKAVNTKLKDEPASVK